MGGKENAWLASYFIYAHGMDDEVLVGGVCVCETESLYIKTRKRKE